MDTVNVEITERLIEENKDDLKRYRQMYQRNEEAYKMFRNFIRYPILDIGCREGILLTIIQKEFDSALYGVDISEKAIRYMNSNLLPEDKLKGIVANAELLPFPDNSFNTVFALHVIEHCRNHRKAIHELYRIVAPGGFALVEIPLQKKEPVPTKWGHWYCFESEEDILKSFNFLFKKITIFKKEKKPWRRIVFKKEE